ncbi:Zinc finger ccch domain-containing protein [Thalictrum thalictroides]|uniref:Zinc finger ccch domain-containing protein n=1 Tax=Thalictrum thalictroides TaxID=46969 RepID=A0A7J6X3M6_THATH|nr:Zinc finger ccch domain-containing protein [Thalictrum thalictroides]
MTNQIYGYNPSSYSNAYTTSKTVTDPYALSSDPLLSSSDQYSSSKYNSDHHLHHRGGGGGSSLMYPNTDAATAAAYLYGNGTTTSTDIEAGAFSHGSRISSSVAATLPASASTALHSSWPGFDVAAVSGGYDPVLLGMKRQNEAFYHQSVLGNHNTFGQNEALFSTNTLAKRLRLESGTSLPICPQRPGEKDCAHYMLTRTCKFGESCKFDHPIWVPEGGIPDWKEVPLVPSSELLPERLGQPDCPYFLKTQKCKFGFRCKFNHPKDKQVSSIPLATVNVFALPERPSEPPCSFYMKTGKCKFGATCRFHHPRDIQIPPPSDQEKGNSVQIESAVKDDGTGLGDVKPAKSFVPFTPALLHNSKGLPVRLGEVDCPFYLKTGSCKYGATCRYNHPDRHAIYPPVAAGLTNTVISSSPAANLNFGVINPAASILPAIDPRLAQTMLGPTLYPQRPGQIECDFYMKTGECKFGESCKFHHPIDRSAPMPSTTNQPVQQNVKLTLAGLPRREGTIICPFYLKTGTCKYGITCRFDHPPLGEAIAMATVQGTSNSVGGEGDKGTETIEEPRHKS